ncbi:hypothetical protein KVH30_02485 [Streptomyces olivaceus]|uniref:hypothetical protein n=1 Tax=Streptomyces olivaceus TaxID=47716 RepID=UPI001CCBE870|nr:hypothetical protein [Streptomyces olivaceus]MBZ6290441.1 hypothetical protein [Streptomyces olivaceus]MBZ6324393.1 hypothetical protein [Streptomyces olivaceus]
MSELLGINIVDGGSVALLALVFLYVVTGRLVPRKTHEDALADRDNWKNAFLQSEAARQVEHNQTSELLEMARLGGHLLAALPPTPQADGEEVNPGDRMAAAPPQGP